LKSSPGILSASRQPRHTFKKGTYKHMYEPAKWDIS
jgi:hypothetical protein